MGVQVADKANPGPEGSLAVWTGDVCFDNISAKKMNGCIFLSKSNSVLTFLFLFVCLISPWREQTLK